MSLRVWLPLNRDLRNQGLEQLPPLSRNYFEYENYSYKGYCVYHFSEDFLDNIWTISLWVKSSGWAEYNDILLCKNDSDATADSQIYFSILNGASLRITVNGTTIVQAYTFATDTWYHLVASYDGNTVNLYVNGECIKTDTHISNKLTGKLNLGIGGRATNSAGTTGTGNNKTVWFYDVRIYDHALSKKEVAELARGCVLHYPMNDTLNESTVNLSSTPSNNGSATSAYAWDQTKHADAIKPGGSWSVGYNSGVEEPTIGYHAYWKMMDGVPTMVFTDMNTDIGYPHRWIGISDYSPLLKTIGSNTTYTVSFEAKADRENMYVHGGLYYKRTSDEGWGFRDGSSYTKLSTNWQRYSYTKTTQTVYDVNSIYIYGIQNGNTQRLEGICYVRNFQVEIKDHATPYTPTGRNENLNTANWGAYSNYWSIESQTLTEIKLVSKRATGNTVALANYVLLPKLKANDIITISGYLYKGDTIFKTSQSTLTTYTSSYQTLSFASYDNGYFESIIKVLVNNPEQWIFHSPLFGQTSIGDICYIRNLDIHITPYLKDVSGFDNHSLITGSLPLVTTPKSPRYDKCMNIDNSGTNKNYANCTIAAPQVKSASFWVYIGDSNPTNQVIFCHKQSHLAFGFYTTNNCLVYIEEGDSAAANAQFDITNTKKNSWNHFVISQTDKDNIDLFLNGIKLTYTVSQYWGYQTTNDLYIGRRMRSDGGNIMYFSGKLSDFRLFSRVLTQADVDDLYKDSLSIDKSQNGYCYELNESDAQSSVDVKKNGQLKCKNYSEQFDGLYLPAGTYVDTGLNYNYSNGIGDTWTIEIFIKYDSGGSGRDLMGVTGNSDNYWGVKADGTWDWMLNSSNYTDSDITKYNRITYSHTLQADYESGTYWIGKLQSGTNYSVRNKTIYHVKLWKNGVLERDLYPCSINNQCGLIDGLTGTFYPANNSNASLVSGTVEAKIGKNGLVTMNKIHEI